MTQREAEESHDAGAIGAADGMEAEWHPRAIGEVCEDDDGMALEEGAEDVVYVV